MKPLRIVFMGTPDFAVAILEHLLDKGKNIVGVITAPDKPAGRGRRMNESAVKRFAKEKGLHILQPTNLKSPEFLKELKELNADLQIVVAFRMLPKEVWSMPPKGTFNLHASLLPDYRGAAPINWAIIKGERKTGVTTFFIDEKIDTGAVILQEEEPVSETDTAGTLHDKLMGKGSGLVLKTLEMIEKDRVVSIPQPVSSRKVAPKLNKENTRIDWSFPVKKVYDHIRGLSPYPLAWSVMDNINQHTDVKIYKASPVFEPHDLKPGKILSTKKELKVAAKDGFIKIEELKASGKMKMDAVSFMNGYRIDPAAQML